MALAFRLLRNSSFCPEWIEMRRVICQAAAQARAHLAAVHRGSPARTRAETAFVEHALAINRQVFALNP